MLVFSDSCPFFPYDNLFLFGSHVGYFPQLVIVSYSFLFKKGVLMSWLEALWEVGLVNLQSGKTRDFILFFSLGDLQISVTVLRAAQSKKASKGIPFQHKDFHFIFCFQYSVLPAPWLLLPGDPEPRICVVQPFQKVSSSGFFLNPDEERTVILLLGIWGLNYLHTKSQPFLLFSAPACRGTCCLQFP